MEEFCTTCYTSMVWKGWVHQPGKQLFAWIDKSAVQSLQCTEEIIYVSSPHDLKPATLDQQASPKVHRPVDPGGGKGGSIFVGVAGRPTRATETSLLFSHLTNKMAPTSCNVGLYRYTSDRRWVGRGLQRPMLHVWRKHINEFFCVKIAGQGCQSIQRAVWLVGAPSVFKPTCY